MIRRIWQRITPLKQTNRAAVAVRILRASVLLELWEWQISPDVPEDLAITVIVGNLGNNGSGAKAGGTSSGGNSTKTITLGGSMSKTGSLSHEGHLYLDSYKMTVNDINKKGGVEVGGKKYKFDLKIYDDQSDPSKARQLYQRVIQQDNIDFLIGPYSSGVNLAAKPIINKNKKPMIEGGGSAPKIFKSGNKYIFGTLVTAPEYPKGLMNLAKSFDSPSVSKVAIANANDVFSKATAQGAIDFAKKQGWDVAVHKSFPPDSNDLSSVLHTVDNASPEVFVLAGHYKQAVTAVKQMSQYDINIPFVIDTVGAVTHDFIDTLGAKGNYVCGTSQWANSANYKGFFYGSAPDYIKRFKKAYDYSPDYHNASGSAVILNWYDVFKRADSLDDVGHIRDLLAKTDLKTFFGPIKYASDGQITGKPPAGYQWQNKKKKLVYPSKYAKASAKYPTPKWSNR